MAEQDDQHRRHFYLQGRAEPRRFRSLLGGGNDPDWQIGKQNRYKGSLHTDRWKGSALALASRGVIGIYPASGWWKTRQRLERFNSAARYTAVVFIHASEVDVDLYSAGANQIAAPVAVQF